MLDKTRLQELVYHLAQITHQQAQALEQSDIEGFMELSDQRQQTIQQLLTMARESDIQAYLAATPELATRLQTVMKLDQQHIQHLQHLMHDTQSQLRQITTGRTAFYAYTGRDNLRNNEETHFIDRQH